jgi:hypothetical protein
LQVISEGNKEGGGGHRKTIRNSPVVMREREKRREVERRDRGGVA